MGEVSSFFVRSSKTYSGKMENLVVESVTFEIQFESALFLFCAVLLEESVLIVVCIVYGSFRKLAN